MNKNLLLVIKSLVFTLLGIIFLETVFILLLKIHINLMQQDGLLANVLLEIVILFVQCLIITNYHKRFSISLLGINFERKDWTFLNYGFCSGFIICALTYFMVFLFKIGFFHGFGFAYYGNLTVTLMVASVFVRAFFAGICEEVFFRGVLLNYLIKFKGKTFGLIVSSTIFAIFHTTRYENLWALLAVLIIGFILGYLYIQTKSLNFSIGFHVATDFFISLAGIQNEPGLFILSVNPKYSINNLEQSIFLFETILCLIFFSILVLINYRNRKKILI